MTHETESTNPLGTEYGGPERPQSAGTSKHNDTDDHKANEDKTDELHDTLKYHLLGPSLTKAGQDSVDQTKVAEIIYNSSKGSKFFNHEEARDRVLTTKIARILERRAALSEHQISRALRDADALLQQLEATRDLSQHVVHVDCDAFFAAVEELDRPELKEVPFAVGKGVLTTCNYHARRFGVRSGMASFVAQKLCPTLILLPQNHAKYSAKADEVRTILEIYDSRFQSASIDEAYLNITAYCEANGVGPAEAVDKMRAEVAEHTKITVSAGIAANARLAKICSNINKPNGQFVLPSEREEIMRFMKKLPTRKVSGIGRVMERELAAIGVNTVGDIYEQRGYIQPLFGDKAFEFLMQAYLGLGRTRIQPAEEAARKSVGTERTFKSISDPQALREKLRHTAEELEKDLARAEVRGRTVVLKVKQHTFEVYTRQIVAGRQVYKADDLYQLGEKMLAKLEEEIEGGLCLRLMGLRCTHLVSTRKPDAASFFGLGTRAGVRREFDEDGWEKWPEELLDGAAVSPGRAPNAERGELVGPEGTADTVPPREQESPEPWYCPICSRPQQPEERLLNEHIDLCLSRQTIRDALQDQARPGTASDSPANASAEAGIGRKRGRSKIGERDPRQKKLCFG